MSHRNVLCNPRADRALWNINMETLPQDCLGFGYRVAEIER